MDRKTFLQAALSVAVTGGLMTNKVQAQGANVALTSADRQRLAGTIDLHIHAAPDTKARLGSELDFARQAKAAGMRAVMFKSNDFSCHDRAYLIREMLPDFETFGSICMNDVVGDKVNVVAAKKALSTTGNLCRCIWMPTQNARHQVQTFKQKQSIIDVTDASGKLLPEVVAVMELCAEYDIIFASGHSSPEETLLMAKQAKAVGLKKFVATHVNSSIWTLTPRQIETVVEAGGWVELSFLTNLWGPGTGLPDYERLSDKAFCDLLSVAPEKSFVSTDLGQVGMPAPVEGMLAAIKAMEACGSDAKTIRLVTADNPAYLVGLK